MVMYTVFSHGVVYKYKTSVCSKATCILTVVSILTFLFPFFLSYSSYVTDMETLTTEENEVNNKVTFLDICMKRGKVIHKILVYRKKIHTGFWLKTDTYKEQPDIHFKHDYLLILETDSLTLPILCGTYSIFNKVSNKIGHCSLVKVLESDNNRDGLHDNLYFEIEVKLLGTNEIKAVTLLLFFDYKISASRPIVIMLCALNYIIGSFLNVSFKDYCWLQMEGLGLIQSSSPLSGIQLDYVADLVMVQRHPLNPRLRNRAYNYSTLNKNDEFIHLSTLLTAYSARSVNTRLENIYSTWTSGRAGGDPFTVKATIFYPEITVSYRPTFWQVIKFGWIQYLSILVISVYIFNSFKKFIYCNRLVHTIKENPFKK